MKSMSFVDKPDFKKNFCFVFMSLLLTFISTPANANVIINEWSQGTSGSPSMGTREWVELLVTTDTDMRGWLLRDIQGTGAGGVYVKFKPAPDTFWQSVPAGTLIVIYNANEKESFFPADDLSLSDGNFTIVTPHNNSGLFDTIGGNQWLLFGNSNSADNPILKNAIGTVIHDWDQSDDGTFTVNPPRPIANQSVHYTGNNETGVTTAANYTKTAASAVTPANPNGGANTAFINFLRNPITSKTPSDDAINIDKTIDITIVFSDFIDGATVIDSSFNIVGSISGSHATVFTGGGTNTITANPDVDFVAGETVTITLTTDIKTMAGVALGKSVTWQFKIIETVNPATPSVAITAIDSVTAITALAKGTAAGDGISERGFFWWTDSTASGTIPANSTGAGNFNLTLTNLKPQTTYNVSAYIRIGTQLITSDNRLTFTTTEPRIPTVHTDTDNYTITGTDITLSGEITDIGSSSVMIYGFVYAAHPNPTVWDMGLPFTWDMTLPISSGKPFTGTITNLSPGKYYIRAYAHNSLGTAYGEEFSFIIRGQNTPPTADSQTVNTVENTEIIITLSGQDADNDSLTYMISKLPTKGKLYQLSSDDVSRVSAITMTTVPITVSDPNHKVVYSPADDIGSGSDNFGFKVNDGFEDSAEALITINIAAMNHAPIVDARTFSIAKNVPKDTIVGTVAASDPDGDTLTYSIISGNESEIFTLDSVTGQISVADASKLDAGIVILTVRVSDTNLSADAVMTITVTNISPISSDDTYSAYQGMMLSVPAPGVLANDQDGEGDTLTAAILANPTNGTLKLNADGSFNYMPNADFIGTDQFTYIAKDNHDESDAAVVRIIVHPIIVIPDPLPIIPEQPVIPEVPVTPAVTILNHAPVIYPDTAHLIMKTVDENADNPGMLISDLIDIIPDPITDEDTGAVEGIAVIHAEDANGVWQYGENRQFTDFPKDIRENNSLLLKEDTVIRFVPNPGFAGTAGIVFRAWDQTSGGNTGRADTTDNGGTTAFSKDKGKIAIEVNATEPDTQPLQEDTEIKEIHADNTDTPATPPVIVSLPEKTETPPTEDTIPSPEIDSETSAPAVVTGYSTTVSETDDSGSGCFITAVSE